MLRRTIFLMLIAMLVVAIVWTVVTSTRSRTTPLQPPGEIVKQSKPTLTRLLRPADLKIEESDLELTLGEAEQAKGPKTVSAKHRLRIQNNGKVVYRNVMLSFSYMNSSGKSLHTRNRLIPDPVMPGDTTTISGLVMESVPIRATKCALTILYADMEQSK